MTKPATTAFRFLSLPTVMKVITVLVALGVQTWFVAANGENFIEPTAAEVGLAVQTLASEKMKHPDSKVMLCYRFTSQGKSNSKPVVVVQSASDSIFLSYEVKGRALSVPAQFSVDQKAGRIVVKGSEFSIRWGELRKGHKIAGHIYYLYEANLVNESSSPVGGYLGGEKILSGYCIR